MRENAAWERLSRTTDRPLLLRRKKRKRDCHRASIRKRRKFRRLLRLTAAATPMPWRWAAAERSWAPETPSTRRDARDDGGDDDARCHKRDRDDEGWWDWRRWVREGD